MDLDFPAGKSFAFSIFDDTDVATLEYIRPIYDFLTDMGIRTTKSVWAFSDQRHSDYTGTHTLEHPEYTAYMKVLQSRGFEIAFHGASMLSSERERTERALQIFREIFGDYPRTYAAHSTNRENLYWGFDRVTSPIVRRLYAWLSRERQGQYQGHVKDTPFFWGDLALQHLEYVRTFTYQRVNLLDITRHIVYKDQSKPWNNKCFITCDADNVEEFNRLLAEESQAKLERKRGVCIVSTHFGKGFTKGGQLRPDCRILLERLSQRNGWFVPVSDLLDHLGRVVPVTPITKRELHRLEYHWIGDVLRRELRPLSYEKTEVEYLERARQSAHGPSER